MQTIASIWCNILAPEVNLAEQRIWSQAMGTEGQERLLQRHHIAMDAN